MPELAEVEYYRKQWDPGIGQAITSVAVHGDKRVFRCTNVRALQTILKGARLLGSEASGKQMLFRFSKEGWLGIHLGMTGKLHTDSSQFRPGKHDHLVLFQGERVLVFSDMRQFGLVRFEQSANPPEWWSGLAPSISSNSFTLERMRDFLQRHPKLPVKASLLLQAGFPGVGNWMADEILWFARINPHTKPDDLSPEQLRKLWKAIRFVCREAIERIASDFSEPPKGWLFHERWSANGHCPRDKSLLHRETIAGRTAVWCDRCQPSIRRSGKRTKVSSIPTR
jgi:formamidopyrimidine-DNA glycosylase